MFLVAVGLAVSLLSYNSSDISFNVASKLRPTNVLGYFGSYTADLLMQSFGYASFIILPTFFMLSWRMFNSEKVGYFRAFASLLVALSFACFTSCIFKNCDGNFIGKIIIAPMHRLFPIKNSLLVELYKWALTLFWFVLSFILFCYSSKTSPISIFEFLRSLWLGLVKFVCAVYGYIRKLTNYILGLDDIDSNPDDLYHLGDTLQTKNDFGLGIDSLSTEKAKSDKNKKTTMTPHSFNANSILPPLELLKEANTSSNKEQIDSEALKINSQKLKSVLEEFGINGNIIGAKPGPVITLYELEPAAGIKSSRVIGLAGDIARSMSAISARVAVVPGKNVIGIELPHSKRKTVLLRELLESQFYRSSQHQLSISLGKDIGGQPVIVDLAKMPHLLVAGTTGSGKSVGINAMILSILYRLSPDKCKFIMIDPKMLELSVYDGIPHLLTPVVTDPKKAVTALKWTVSEMESRYRTMAKLGVRNIESYNEKILIAQKSGEELSRKIQTGYDNETGLPIYEYEEIPSETFPYIVVIVDEMADLMLTAGKEIDGVIQRLAQMARAAGIHLIMATQRPSVDVITGTIKANFPTRISFQVASKIDSRTILGEQGGEQLLGQGDMLYMSTGGKIVRVHGPFVSDAEVEAVVNYLKDSAAPSYIDEITREEDDELEFGKDGKNSTQKDPLYDQALEVILREGRATTSFIQRCFQIGYNRAARIIEQMEREGVVSKPNHTGKREILFK